MRYSSAANNDASSPPAPARISMMIFFSSLGSFGVSRMNNSSSNSVNRASVSVISSFARVANSPPSLANFLASTKFFSRFSRSSPLEISVSNSENRLFFTVKSGEL